MAGGKFISMDKIRPGAYINFAANAANPVALGARGIVTMALPLNWGPENSIIEVKGSDMEDGSSLAKIGLVPEDADALLLDLAFQNANVVKIYNPVSGGTKASTTLGEVTESYVLTSDVEIVSGKTYYTRSGEGTELSPYVYTPVAEPEASALSTYYEKVVSEVLTATAKYPGAFGNKIAILIRELTDKFSVETYADGYLVDTQKVTTSSELKSNDYVEFNNGPIVAVSSTLLAGGATGTTPEESTYLRTYFNLLKTVKFHTLSYNGTLISVVKDFIQEMRDEEGKYVQAVVSTSDDVDYEGIINNVNGVILTDDTTITPVQFVAWVAGAIAGASIKESLTGKVVPNATKVSNPLTNDQIIEGLTNGKLILATNQNGDVRVEKDINSLHTFTATKNYSFSKNKIIRILDEIGSYVEDIWETTYMGKVPNNDNGRTLFKSSIINYLTDLQNNDIITDFDSSKVEVTAGQDIDSVIASIAIKPVDSMEYLYMVINVE